MEAFVYKNCVIDKNFCFGSNFDKTLWDCSTHEPTKPQPSLQQSSTEPGTMIYIHVTLWFIIISSLVSGEGYLTQLKEFWVRILVEAWNFFYFFLLFREPKMDTLCPNPKSICKNFAKKIVKKLCKKLCKNFAKNCVKIL